MAKNKHSCNSCVLPMLGVFDEGFTQFKPKTNAPEKDNNAPVKIYTAKNILTMNPLQPNATAVAVSNGLIYAIGELKHLTEGLDKAKRTYEIDDQFKQANILPGFIEAHCHIILIGLFWQWTYLGIEPRTNPEGKLVGGFKTKEAALKGLQEAFKSHQDKNTFFAWGYDPSILDGFPILTRQDLDTVSSTTPIVVMNTSGHIGYANSAALSAVNFSKETNIPGVTKDKQGELNGELKEMAALTPVFDKLLSIDFKLMEKAMQDAAKTAQKKGCTTISELALGYIPHSWDALNSVIDNPSSPVRVSAYPLDDVVRNVGINALKQHMQNNNDRLRIAGVKFVADGSIQGYTANMKWPYYYDGTANGMSNIKNDEYKALFLELHKAGIQTATHVNGDEALQEVMDMMEDVLSTFPRNDHRHRLEHCQLPSQENLASMKKFDILPNFFTNHIYYWGTFHREHSVGPDRVEHMDPVQSAKKLGIRFSLHSDAAITPLDPLKMVWIAAKRQTIDTGTTLGKNECLSVEDGLRAITIDAAYLLNEDETKGSIEIGKFADFAILDKDPLKVKTDDLLKINVLATMCAGNIFR